MEMTVGWGWPKCLRTQGVSLFVPSLRRFLHLGRIIFLLSEIKDVKEIHIGIKDPQDTLPSKAKKATGDPLIAKQPDFWNRLRFPQKLRENSIFKKHVLCLWYILCFTPYFVRCIFSIWNFGFGILILYTAGKLGKELLVLLWGLFCGKEIFWDPFVFEEWEDCSSKKSFHPSMSTRCQQQGHQTPPDIVTRVFVFVFVFVILNSDMTFVQSFPPI